MENAQFLTFLVAIIKAVDEYSDLLRLSVASAGNDHRLGANEAPPAIISIFLGEELENVIEALEEGRDYTSGHSMFNVGVSSLPNFPRIPPIETEHLRSHSPATSSSSEAQVPA